MELIVEKHSLYIVKDKDLDNRVLLQGYRPRNETYTDETIISIIENILIEASQNTYTMMCLRDLMPKEEASNYSTLAFMMGKLCEFYSTEKCDVQKLSVWGWECLAMMKMNKSI